MEAGAGTKWVSLLEQAGHQIVAPDLPGHGDDRTPVAGVPLQAHTDRICEILDAQSEPMILVGHSMGGIVITQAAEQHPDKIKTLVYLTAFLLRDGESLLQHAQNDTKALVLPNLIMAENQSFATVKEEALKTIFYGSCSEEDVAFAQPRLVLQAAAPLATPVSTTDENFGRVPRVYIECLRDKASSPSVQKQMDTTVDQGDGLCLQRHVAQDDVPEVGGCLRRNRRKEPGYRPPRWGSAGCCRPPGRPSDSRG